MAEECGICSGKIDGEATHYYEKKPCHKDCYYDKLGDFVEKNPPGIPHRVGPFEYR